MKRSGFLAWTAPVIAVLLLFLAPPGRLAADILYAVDGAGGFNSNGCIWLADRANRRRN
jgi:hypothetical protein